MDSTTCVFVINHETGVGPTPWFEYDLQRAIEMGYVVCDSRGNVIEPTVVATQPAIDEATEHAVDEEK